MAVMEDGVCFINTMIILGATLAAKDRRGSDNEVGVHAYALGDSTLSMACVAADVHKLSPRGSHEVHHRW